MSIDDTMIVNVGNIPTQGTTNGDNETSYLNDITSCDVMNGDNETSCLNGNTSCDNMNGQNTNLNRDTNGRNTLKFVSDPNNDTDTNSHNNNESTPLSSTENRDGISPSPPCTVPKYRAAVDYTPRLRAPRNLPRCTANSDTYRQ